MIGVCVLLWWSVLARGRAAQKRKKGMFVLCIFYYCRYFFCLMEELVLCWQGLGMIARKPKMGILFPFSFFSAVGELERNQTRACEVLALEVNSLLMRAFLLHLFQCNLFIKEFRPFFKQCDVRNFTKTLILGTAVKVTSLVDQSVVSACPF